jgi:dUTP pyrophosphatase
MQLKIKRLNEDAILPKYTYDTDACFDLYSNDHYEIPPNGRFQIATGIAMQIPDNHVGFIWDKSGLSHKNGLKTLGGVIDSGYRGEIKVGIINLGHEVYKIEKGDRVAQMIIQQKIPIEIVESEELDETERGESAFGSSGK